MPFPMDNNYALGETCYTDAIQSAQANFLVRGVAIFVPVTLETPIEEESELNKIKTPVIRFYPINIETNEYYPYFIDVTNAPILANLDDGLIYTYTLCDADDIAGVQYFKRPHFTNGCYVIFNPYDHAEYRFANTTDVEISNEMLHACEPWPVPDQIDAGGGQ